MERSCFFWGFDDAIWYAGLNVLVTQHQLQWLGHVGRKNDNCLPKKLFGELLPTRLAHGPKLRWRDLELKDIQSLGFDALNWFNAAQDRSYQCKVFTVSPMQTPMYFL